VILPLGANTQLGEVSSFRGPREFDRGLFGTCIPRCESVRDWRTSTPMSSSCDGSLEVEFSCDADVGFWEVEWDGDALGCGDCLWSCA
jgi:hypothetical protein